MYGQHEDKWTADFRNQGTPADWDAIPEGLMNVCPQAGDMVLMAGATSHAVLPWRGRGPRLSLIMRYKSGQAYELHRRNQYDLAKPGGRDGPWLADVVAALTPSTRTMIYGTGDGVWRLPRHQVEMQPHSKL